MSLQCGWDFYLLLLLARQKRQNDRRKHPSFCLLHDHHHHHHHNGCSCSCCSKLLFNPHTTLEPRPLLVVVVETYKNQSLNCPNMFPRNRVAISHHWMMRLFGLLCWMAVGARGEEQNLLNDEHSIVVPIDHLALTPQNEVQYIEGYFGGEGYIDLSTLVFTSLSGTGTQLDLAVVRVPEEVCPQPPPSLAGVAESCPKSQWMGKVGIGAQIGAGGWWWCCTNEIAGQCPSWSTNPHEKDDTNADAWGFLMVNTQVMDGTLRHLDLETVNTTIPPQEAQFYSDKGGYFVILMANCDTLHGQPVDINGNVVFVSLQERIDEEVKEEVPFYLWATVAYISLFFWFAHLMHVNKESRIRLEEWIFGTLAIGMAEVLFRGLEYLLWERTGHRNAFIALVAAVAYGLKHGIFRGLLVFLCSGAGVTCATLEDQANTALVVLTIAYVTLSTSFYYLTYVEQRRAASIQGFGDDDQYVNQIIFYLLFGMIFIDILFLLWIPRALRRTIAHLRSTNQERKLVRFRWLVRILLSAVALTFVLGVAVVLDVMYNKGRLTAYLDVYKVNEIEVFFILLLIACLWRPNPMAREYAYVMEAPTEDNDLELVESSATYVPESPDANYKSFPIESAEAT